MSECWRLLYRRFRTARELPSGDIGLLAVCLSDCYRFVWRGYRIAGDLGVEKIGLLHSESRIIREVACMFTQRVPQQSHVHRCSAFEECFLLRCRAILICHQSWEREDVVAIDITKTHW